MAAYPTSAAATPILAVRPFPKPVPCLDASACLRLPLAVSTSTRHEMALRAFEAAGILPYFRDVSRHDSAPHGKPHPEMGLTLALEDLCATAPDRVVAAFDFVPALMQAAP